MWVLPKKTALAALALSAGMILSFSVMALAEDRDSNTKTSRELFVEQTENEGDPDVSSQIKDNYDAIAEEMSKRNYCDKKDNAILDEYDEYLTYLQMPDGKYSAKKSKQMFDFYQDKGGLRAVMAMYRRCKRLPPRPQIPSEQEVEKLLDESQHYEERNGIYYYDPR